MKLVFEFARIAPFCFAGEVCHLVLPLPIPASVYGLMLLLAALYVLLSMKQLLEAGQRIAKGELDCKVDTSKLRGPFKEHGEDLNSITDGMNRAVGERMKSERFRTELITNVSHDIKTPLTSIINYVDLLEKEQPENEKMREYLEVLDRQSAKLKKLIDDLMDMSKASTGNMSVFITQVIVQ